jgi:integrase
VGSISPQKRNGTVVGYSVYLGVDAEGRRQRKFFAQLADAEKLVRIHSADPRPVGELLDRKAEILFCLEQLRPLAVSLPDVVEFYVQHHARKGNPTLSELVELFVSEKRRIGRSAHYERSMRYYLNGFMSCAGRDVRISDITREQIADHVYGTNKDAGVVTKKNILTHLSVLFNFAIKEDLLGINPVDKITRPTIPFNKPHVLSPDDFSRLLNCCLEHGWNDRLVLFVLVGFCGIRVEEASRLSWSHLHLDKSIVEVPAEFAKKARFRNNRIPPNAMAWLRTVEDKRRTGPLIKDHWTQNLRSAVTSAKIDYRQNCIRHSFCSYALASGWSLADVIAYMGHSGSPAMIFSHYRNVVSEEDGKKWFEIVP